MVATRILGIQNELGRSPPFYTETTTEANNTVGLQVDRVDEILEGYRTFTALAAEVSTPGGSGIMSRYGTEPTTRSSSSSSSSSNTSKRMGATAFPPSSSSSGTLDDYGPDQRQQQQQQQQQQRGGGSQQLARRGGVEPAEGGALARQEGGRRGQGVAYIDPASDPVMMDALRLLFAKEGNYVQDLVRLCVCTWRETYWCARAGGGVVR